MPRFDLCIFDLDGTLAQTLPAIHKSLNTTLQRHGFPTHTPEQVEEMIGEGLRVLIEKAVPGDVAPGSPVFESIVKEYGRELVTFSTLAKPFPGIKDMLAELADREVLLAVCSNKTTAAVERTLAACFGEWRSTFMAVVGVDERHRPKPCPDGVREIIAAAEERLGRAAGRDSSEKTPGSSPHCPAPNAVGTTAGTGSPCKCCITSACVGQASLPDTPTGTLGTTSTEVSSPAGSGLRVLFVGDSYVDIATAKAAGLPCVGCHWGYAGTRGLDGATRTVTTASELQDIILGLADL